MSVGGGWRRPNVACSVCRAATNCASTRADADAVAAALEKSVVAWQQRWTGGAGARRENGASIVDTGTASACRSQRQPSLRRAARRCDATSADAVAAASANPDARAAR